MLNSGPQQPPIQPQLVLLQHCEYCDGEKQCYVIGENGPKYCKPCILKMVKQALK